MIAFISKVSESTCQRADLLALKAYDFVNDLLYALDKPVTFFCSLTSALLCLDPGVGTRSPWRARGCPVPLSLSQTAVRVVIFLASTLQMDFGK